MDATRNPSIIALWRKQWPSANWAVATGSKSGIVVIDIDPQNGGWGSLLDLQKLNRGLLPATWEVETGGGGLHKYFRIPRGLLISSRNRWMSGIDIKGEGGYVIGVGSRHISGGQYRWKAGHSPSDIELAILPDSLIPLMPITNKRPLRRYEACKQPTAQPEPTGERKFVGLVLKMPA